MVDIFVIHWISVLFIFVRQFDSGFDDWKNINVKIVAHIQSMEHFHTMKTIVDLQKCKKLDMELINQFNNKKKALDSSFKMNN